MDVERTITTFTDYYVDRDHRRVTGSTLLPPPGDPVLFTTSGMHPLTPYLHGRPHPLGERLVNVQRCLRTTDLDEVGDDTHLTVFEMVGTWSLGDYDGPQSLRWGYDLLCHGFGIDHDRLHVTVFGGDEHLGPDLDSLRVWQELGVPVEWGSAQNWWSNGPTGLCGPDSEIFVWMGDTPPRGTPDTDPRWVEVWNHVTMGYRRHDDGTLQPLGRVNVDTGMGLERLLTVLQGRRSIFECDIFEPWVRSVRELWPLDETSRRVVVDHLRASTVTVGDGVRPSNTGCGYVLRRLIRRLLTAVWRTDPTRTLGDLPTEPFAHTVQHFRQQLPVEQVRAVLLDEEERFRALLRRGRPVVSRLRSRGPLGEQDFGYLHDTHGLPREFVVGLLTDAD